MARYLVRIPKYMRQDSGYEDIDVGFVDGIGNVDQDKYKLVWKFLKSYARSFSGKSSPSKVFALWDEQYGFWVAGRDAADGRFKAYSVEDGKPGDVLGVHVNADGALISSK